MSKAKWFKDSEIRNLDPKLVKMLDKARENAGVPFKITSGFRTKEQNEAVGGAPNSAHLRGLAVDLRCSNNSTRFKMISSLISVGFTRIEISPMHIHVDVDYSLPSPVLFLGPDN